MTKTTYMTVQQQTKSILDILKEMSSFNLNSAENHTTNQSVQSQGEKTQNNAPVKQGKK